MKFLCVNCDEQMRLTETLGADADAVSAIFECPQCGHRIAMLTNSMETQLVKSLDVKIGGRSDSRHPMSVVQSSLQAPHETPEDLSSGGKCPFPGAIKEALTESEIVWDESAIERLQRIPVFVRPMVKRGIEEHARDKGIQVITTEVMADVRTTFGM